MMKESFFRLTVQTASRNASTRKYLFLIPFLLLIGFCAYFYAAMNHMEDRLLREKIADRRFAVNIICDEIDRLVETDDNWGVYDYVTILSDVVAQIDGTGGTYAELFDEGIHGVSERSPLFDGAPFDPMEYPDLARAMRENEAGEMVVEFDKPGAPKHDLSVYFRWVPTDTTLEHRLLVVVGVSKFSIDSDISVWVAYGAAVLIIVTAALMLGAVILLCRLGSIYELRGGASKWRRPISSR